MRIDFREFFQKSLDNISLLRYNNCILLRSEVERCVKFPAKCQMRLYETMAVVPSILVCLAGNITVFSHNMSNS